MGGPVENRRWSVRAAKTARKGSAWTRKRSFQPTTTLTARVSNPIPEPSAALVFGAGLVTVAVARRRER